MIVTIMIVAVMIVKIQSPRVGSRVNFDNIFEFTQKQLKKCHYNSAIVYVVIVTITLKKIVINNYGCMIV